MTWLRSQRRLFIVSGGIIVSIVCLGFLLPALAFHSNCGRNTAALAAMRSIYICFALMASDHGDGPVSVTELSSTNREYFKGVLGLSWLRRSKVLVTSARIKVGQSAGKEIIAVCDTPFNNVPRRTFGQAPFTHAVAYQDGSIGLMPVDEFKRLDLSGFVDIRTIQEVKVGPGGSAIDSLPIVSGTNRESSTGNSRL